MLLLKTTSILTHPAIAAHVKASIVGPGPATRGLAESWSFLYSATTAHVKTSIVGPGPATRGLESWLSRGQKRAFTTQGSLNTSLIIESCTLSIFPQQHNRIEFGVSSLANKLHLASKNLQNKHLITVGTGFGNTRAPKTHHTMRNSRRLARYKAHGFFLAPRRHWDALTKHAGRINYKNGMANKKNVLLLRIGLNNSCNIWRHIFGENKMASEKVTDELTSVESTVCIEDLGKKKFQP